MAFDNYLTMPDNAINLLMNYEELHLQAYDAGEGTGILTIGYGQRSGKQKRIIND